MIKIALQYAPLVAGLYLTVLASIMDTSNWRSHILFRAVPALLALALVVPYAS